MRPVHETCEPRRDILAGTFNPEIFTASFPQVLDHYRGRAAAIDNIYTDPVQFFTQATYATDGLKRVLGEVFGRLSGDNTMPAIHRADGGGKVRGGGGVILRRATVSIGVRGGWGWTLSFRRRRHRGVRRHGAMG